MLERRYPMAFDLVVKNVMTSNPRRKRNGLKNVLGKEEKIINIIKINKNFL